MKTKPKKTVEEEKTVTDSSKQCFGVESFIRNRLGWVVEKSSIGTLTQKKREINRNCYASSSVTNQILVFPFVLQQ